MEPRNSKYQVFILLLMNFLIIKIIIIKPFILKKYHVTISSTDSSEEIDENVVHIKNLEKRKEAYGICGECNEPGTGFYWCQPCNVKRFEKNFNNWTSGMELLMN